MTDIFVSLDKEGSQLGAWVRAWSIAVSKNLQAGVPLTKIVGQYKGMQFDPRGPTSNDAIPIAKSVPDYIVRWLDLRFGEKGNV